MFCTRCGKEFEEDNLFCPFCGAEVEDVEAEIRGLSPEEAAEWRVREQTVENEISHEDPMQENNDRSVTKRKAGHADHKKASKEHRKKDKKSSKKVIWIIAVVLVVLIGAAIGAYIYSQSNQSVEINLCELMTEPTFDGDNGYATIENNIVIEKDKAEDVIDQFEDEEKQIQLESFLSTVEYVASPNNNLKNGDKVKIIATYDEDLADVLELDLTGRETTITVKGLKQGQTSNDMVRDQSSQKDWTEYSYDFIFPYSSDEYIEEDVLTNYSSEDIQWAINEIYARHGYIFDVEPYQSYFSGCEWYTPMYRRAQFKSSWLNTYEDHNIKLLSKYR